VEFHIHSLKKKSGNNWLNWCNTDYCEFLCLEEEMYDSEILGFCTYPLSGILGTRKHDIPETDPVSETSCFLVPRIPDDG
jgi:hypothetical protein